MISLKIFSRIDWLLVIPIVILATISLVTLYSVSPAFFTGQFFFFIIAGIAFVVFANIRISSYHEFFLPIYIFSVVSLIVVLLIGTVTKGAVRWVDILGFRIQFSEVLKPFLIVCLAGLLEKRNDHALSSLGVVLVCMLPIVFLLYRQPDLGNAIIYVGVVVVTLSIYGFPLWWFMISAVLFGGAIPLMLPFLHSYQRDRVLSFLHLTNDPLTTSYNAIQAVIAVGSGGFWGKGLGQGTQSSLRFLPERQTDFIFATLSEDLGLVGSLLVIGTFLFLFYRLYTIFNTAEDTFEKTIIVSAFALLLIQFFINIGMNIGLVPIIGVTLPFVSLGGSSILSNAILLGIVSSIATSIRRKNMFLIK